MQFRYTRHAVIESMPDEKISAEEVEEAVRKSSHTVRISAKKYQFHYRGLVVVAQKEHGYWLIITCWRR